MIELLRTPLAVVFVLGIMIFIHELGHFVTAKLNNMHVYQFMIGFGPKIFKYQGKETLYSVCLLPFGGMVDLREDENDPTNTRSFSSKKPYQRLMVILAGAFMNFVLAYVFIVGIYLTEPFPTTTIGELAPDMPAMVAGIEVDDTIVSINGEAINYWTDIRNNIAYSDETSFLVEVDRDGELLTFTMSGDRIDGEMRIGIVPTFEKNPSLAFSYGFKDFIDKSTMIIDGFRGLASGEIGFDKVSGPVGIIRQVGEVAETNNFKNILYFTAILSINLGIFNLIPFPFLDGGRALFIFIEMIRRKPIDKDKEAYVHFAGMVVLLGLMVVLVFKDLVV